MTWLTRRLLPRNPLVTIVATLSLAIGIGANTTVFTVANDFTIADRDGGACIYVPLQQQYAAWCWPVRRATHIHPTEALRYE